MTTDETTDPDQNDPLAVYYAEVLEATNRFYASMERQRRAALHERQAQPHAADQAHTPEDAA